MSSIQGGVLSVLERQVGLLSCFQGVLTVTASSTSFPVVLNVSEVVQTSEAFGDVVWVAQVRQEASRARYSPSGHYVTMMKRKSTNSGSRTFKPDFSPNIVIQRERASAGGSGAVSIEAFAELCWTGFQDP